MPSQIERSKSRKTLARISGNAVLKTIARLRHDSEKSLSILYEMVCRELIRRLIESYTSSPITNETIRTNPDLVFLMPTVDLEDGIRNAPEFDEPVSFMIENSGAFSPEDLGGISELFSGHSAILTDSGVEFVNDISRRGAGRIYTPFDVTLHMCEGTIPDIVSNCHSFDCFLRLRIIDPACGSGAFLAQASRILIREAICRWPEREDEITKHVFSAILHGIDLDGFAVNLCKLVLWMEAGSPEDSIGFRLAEFDSLSKGADPSFSDWSKYTGLELIEGYDLWIGNPPYVRVKPSEYDGFVYSDARNLYALFCELGISLTKKNGTFSMILPQGVVVSRDADRLRSFLLGIRGSKTFQVFDSVPDFLFDQGKIESNSNTNINQRTTIVTVQKGREEEILTSPLIRWRRSEERNYLFRNLRNSPITKEDRVHGKIPMLGSDAEVALFRDLVRRGPKIGERIGKGTKSLYMTKAVRYFITALPKSLGRANSIELIIPEEDFHSIHVILNSNVFYWWWRVIGNGFQLERGDIDCFPMIPIDPQRASLLSRRLSKAEDSCRVIKRNAGKDIPNVNYNYSMDLILEIDSEILSSFSDLDFDFILKSKSNSLFGKMDGLVGYS